MRHDAELLRRYVQEASEGAFTELVQEHVNLVYAAALRETGGDAAGAEDISQSVFSALAQQAPRLLHHPTLAGWLYTAVRNFAANERRSQQHRRRREEEVQTMNELLSADSPQETWQRLRPVIDDALHEMRETDRMVVVLRFLEDRSLREVGDCLGLNENAARMRVDRALEKLRGLLARRGITSTATGLAGALAIGIIVPAPPALAATISASALVAGAAIGSTSVTCVTIMSLATKLKIAAVSAAILAGVAVPVWQQQRLQQIRSENDQLRSQIQSLSVAPAPAPVAASTLSTNDLAELEHLRQWQASTQPELLRLRAMAGVARRANDEAEQLRAKLAKQASESTTNPVSGAMSDFMQQAMEQQFTGRLNRMVSFLKLTPAQTDAIREILKKQAQTMSAGMQQVFSGKIDKDELTRLGKAGGNPEEQIKALLTPDQKDAYQGYQKEEAAYNARLMANNEMMQLQSTLGLNAEQQDRVFAALYDVSFNQISGNLKPPTSNQADAVQWMLDQKTKALESVLTPTQLDSYREQLAVQSKFMKDIMKKMDISGSAK